MKMRIFFVIIVLLYLTGAHAQSDIQVIQAKGRATILNNTAGPMKGRRPDPVPHGDDFAFSWLVFKPDTEVYTPPTAHP